MKKIGTGSHSVGPQDSLVLVSGQQKIQIGSVFLRRKEHTPSVSPVRTKEGDTTVCACALDSIVRL